MIRRSLSSRVFLIDSSSQEMNGTTDDSYCRAFRCFRDGKPLVLVGLLEEAKLLFNASNFEGNRSDIDREPPANVKGCQISFCGNPSVVCEAVVLSLFQLATSVALVGLLEEAKLLFKACNGCLVVGGVSLSH